MIVAFGLACGSGAAAGGGAAGGGAIGVGAIAGGGVAAGVRGPGGGGPPAAGAPCLGRTGAAYPNIVLAAPPAGAAGTAGIGRPHVPQAGAVIRTAAAQ